MRQKILLYNIIAVLTLVFTGCLTGTTPVSIRSFNEPSLIEYDPNVCGVSRNEIYDTKVTIGQGIFYQRQPVQDYIACTISQMKRMKANLTLWENALQDYNEQLEDDYNNGD